MRRLYHFALIIALALTATLAWLPAQVGAAQTQESPLRHDSRDLVYRSPGGAVPEGTEVTLRARTKKSALDVAVLRLYDGDAQKESFYNMHKALTTPDGFDFWEYTLKTPTKPTVLYYRFILRKSDVVVYYEDDTKDDAGNYDISRKGGAGAFYSATRDQSWQITVYAPDFKTPQWMHDAVIYQIFPDRFRDGDKSNDPTDGSQTFYGNLKLTFHKTWNEMVTDFKINTSLQPNSDFFGGDLKGIEEKLPYLRQLGVTAIYLNPIFEARSNHRYDTADYHKIDPMLGTQADWDSLVKAADAQGIHLILDGVFNHVSSDGPIFDRYHRFSGGACEDLNSKFRSWFFFQTPRTANDTSNGCVDDGKGDTAYVSWANFDSIPKLNNASADVRSYIYGAPDSVARTWLKDGAKGWRLDVANEIDDGSSANTYWEEFRKAVKGTDPDAVIIGEFWNDASPWLTGTQMDSSMNYRVRTSVLPFIITAPFGDNDGSWQPLTPSKFDGAIQAMIEDYPPQAMNAMMNLLDSHDTTRLSFVAGDSQSQKLAAFLQYMLPGAPTIYYGDEIGLKAPDINGQDDPYNRAPYPWADEKGNFYAAPNADMLAYYTNLAQVRDSAPVLRDGAYRTLLTDDQNGVYAFLRSAQPENTASADVALVIANKSTSDQTFSVDVSCLDDGITLNNALKTGAGLTVKDGTVSGTIKARSGAVYVGADSGSCRNFNAPLASNRSTTSTQAFSAVAGDGKVEIEFPVRDAIMSYDVYRSYFPNAGFVKLTDKPTTDAKYVDSTVSNGTHYYYYLVGRASGIAAIRSSVLNATPAAAVAKASVAAADNSTKVSAPLSVKGVEISAIVTFDSPNPQNVMAQVALTSPDKADKSDIWQTLDSQSGTGAVTFKTTLQAAQPGDYVATARFSADAGANWTVSNKLPVAITAPALTTKPATPANLKVGDVGMFKVSLSWDAVPGAYAYRVYKGGVSDQQVIGETTQTNFRDFDVFTGDEYKYSVAAIDESLNESEHSPIQVASVANQGADVTFHVTVPANTPKDASVYIAGDFGTKDYPQWNPGADNMKLTDKGNNVWEITLKLPPGATIQYKFVRGDWSAVEKGKDCDEIANRTLFVKPGANMREDAVLKWRDTDQCG